MSTPLQQFIERLSLYMLLYMLVLLVRYLLDLVGLCKDVRESMALWCRCCSSVVVAARLMGYLTYFVVQAPSIFVRLLLDHGFEGSSLSPIP